MKTFHDGKVTLYAGDCLDVLKTMPENSVDAVVTDPPYHLTNNNGTRSPYPGQYTPIGRPKQPKGGFMGKQWDGGDIAFRPELWAEVLRVLKPGGHMVCFGGTRTYHRMVCAIEDAGFEVRDQLAWVYGSGFPKSHDVSKGIDRAADVEREIIGRSPFDARKPNGSAGINLVRLVCQKGATVLDPFAGTGTTGAASFIEGRRCVLIEREAEYLADIERRMELLLSGSDERARKLAKAEPYETLPLFA